MNIGNNNISQSIWSILKHAFESARVMKKLAENHQSLTFLFQKKFFPSFLKPFIDLITLSK